MPYYIEDPVSKYLCIGNSLSSLQISLSSLDTAVFELSSSILAIVNPTVVTPPLVSMSDPRGTVGSECYDTTENRVYKKIGLHTWVGWDIFTTF